MPPPNKYRDPYAGDSSFRGVTINPVEYDDVSAFTDVMTTSPYMNNYSADEESNIRQNKAKPSRGYYDEGDARYSHMHHTSKPDRDLDPYDEFCKKVFNTPTVVGDHDEEREGASPGFRKGIIAGAIIITAILLGVVAVLFGVGILDVSGEKNSSSAAAATSNLVSTTESPTRAPVTTTTNGLLPETATPSFADSKPRPTSPPTLEPTTDLPVITTPQPTELPTLPDATPSPTSAPVSSEPTTSPTNAPVTAPPTPTPSSVTTPSPTANPTPVPTESSTPFDSIGLTTVQPKPPTSDGTAMPDEAERYVIRKIGIRMEEEAYSSYYTAPPGGEEKLINLSITLNGRTYRTYSCYMVKFCEPYETIKLYEWLYVFPDSTEWYMDGLSSPFFGNDGFEAGTLELRIHVDDGDDYVWSIDASQWFGRTSPGFETPNSRDINGNGPWMRWQFDVSSNTI